MSFFDAEVTSIATNFWARSGVKGPYPRALEPAVFVVLPIAVLRLPRLRLRTAIAWLSQRGFVHRSDTADRALHGYLIARGGIGVVFLDGTDPLDEQLFSLAHEVAHFLYDYLRPRTLALNALGRGIEEVLDGLRPPTPEERLAGILRGVPLGVYSHLGRRSSHGEMVDPDILLIEDKADQLALELLAPLATVVASVRSRLPARDATAQDAVVSLLQAGYGLPVGVATIYARTVLSAARSGRSFREWLGA
jgi:hypothetical protein